MKLSGILSLSLSIFLFAANASAQRTEITISFSEQFFDALLDAVFQHSAPPEFSLAKSGSGRQDQNPHVFIAQRGIGAAQPQMNPCNESIRLLRESDGIRTAVRFREGKILAPLVFTGNYNPPLIGCVPFGGWAQTTIELEFDQAGQRLIARARVQNVSLNGTGGIASGVVARMVQSSIDKKINPIELVKTDKVSFLLPLQNSNGVRMKATGFTHEVAAGQLNVRIGYEFEKAR
jgi:hypothetical protein